MRAAVYYGIETIKHEKRPRPEPGPGEVLLKVGAAGICGTDLRIYANGHHRIAPGTTRILGHELAGEIVAVGEGIGNLSPGVRVGVAPNVGCGVCAQCVAGWTNLCQNYKAFGISLDGAFAEYMLITADAIKQGNVTPIPNHVPYVVAALAEPLSCCFNGQEAVGVGRDDVVLIVGAGPIGIMHLLLARVGGARRVIVSEISETRRRQAEEHGADAAINPRQDDLQEAVLEMSQGEGASVVIVAAAAPRAQEQSLELAARQGRINFFGGLPKDRPSIQFNSNLVHYKQLIVTGTTGSNVRQYRSSMNLIAAGRVKLDTLVGARLPLDRIHEGIERSKAGAEMRIVVEPSA
jgi:L-iditol 2-dehydrogenase